MKAPIVARYLRAVENLNRRARAAEKCALVMRMQRDEALELVVDLNDDLGRVTQERDCWRRRAEALYDACAPGVRDGVLGVITTIEGLPEVAG